LKNPYTTCATQYVVKWAMIVSAEVAVSHYEKYVAFKTRRAVITFPNGPFFFVLTFLLCLRSEMMSSFEFFRKISFTEPLPLRAKYPSHLVLLFEQSNNVWRRVQLSTSADSYIPPFLISFSFIFFPITFFCAVKEIEARMGLSLDSQGKDFAYTENLEVQNIFSCSR
jgi:hypothetical protein